MFVYNPVSPGEMKKKWTVLQDIFIHIEEGCTLINRNVGNIHIVIISTRINSTSNYGFKFLLFSLTL